MNRAARLVVVASAALATTAVAGCSSDPQQPTLPPGQLVSGTAHITVDGKDLGQFQAVSCTTAGTLTTITTGNDDSGSVTVLSNADGLSAQSVSIRELGGFTGSYNAGLGGKATVTLDDATYSITGNADGFATDKPSFRTNGTFAINVAC